MIPEKEDSVPLLPEGWCWAREPKERPDVLVRADGGWDIGVGHWMRSAVLAERLISHGLQPFLVTRKTWEGPYLPLVLRSRSLPVAVIPAGEGTFLDEARKIIPLMKLLHSPIVITDHYDVKNEYLQQIYGHASVLVSIDDICETEYPVDILLNQNAGSSRLRYVTGAETQVLLGPEYALLRPAFRKLRPDKPRMNSVRVILLSAGGGGSTESALETILTELSRLLEGTDISLRVLGGVGLGVEDLGNMVGDRVEVIQDYSNSLDYLLDVDLAITTAGSTIYELMCLGIPLITFTVERNQEIVEEGLMSKLSVARRISLVAPDSIGRVVQEVIDDGELRLEMSAAGLRLVDGRGADRVTSCIVKRLEENRRF